jgi:predicted DNA-binding transcriptional regulator AlpA
VSADVLRPAEFRARLGISRTRFWELESEGRFKRLQNLTVSAALGTRVYDRKRVDAFFADRLEILPKRKAG